MKIFELPKMEMQSFKTENIITQSGIPEIKDAMQTWADENQAQIKDLNYNGLADYLTSF